MTGPDRAVAVVIRDRRILVVHRQLEGRTYAVLPGGGIEPGETAEAAVVRELREETGLVGEVGQMLWVRHDGGRRASYFRMDAAEGLPVLGGPERERSTAGNRYTFSWAAADRLAEIDLQPPEITQLLHELLTSP